MVLQFYNLIEKLKNNSPMGAATTELAVVHLPRGGDRPAAALQQVVPPLTCVAGAIGLDKCARAVAEIAKDLALAAAGAGREVRQMC